jgi:hypothetical protein
MPPADADQLSTGHHFCRTPFSDDFAITTIARAHSHGVAETAAKRPGGEQGRAPVVAGDVDGFNRFGQSYIQ